MANPKAMDRIGLYAMGIAAVKGYFAPPKVSKFTKKQLKEDEEEHQEADAMPVQEAELIENDQQEAKNE